MGDILSHFTLRLVHGWQVYGMMFWGEDEVDDEGGRDVIVLFLCFGVLVLWVEVGG